MTDPIYTNITSNNFAAGRLAIGAGRD